jgi:hypothetical protein
VSFGQLVIGDDILQYYLLGDFFWGRDIFRMDLTPAILYGITDELAAYLRVPFTPANTQGDQSSFGIEDIILQFEYAYYTYNTRCYTNLGTIVTAIYYPTGDAHKNPPTGFGAPAFFIGGTFSHESIWRYFFFCPGALFPTENHGTKYGDQYLYEFGYEHIIYTIKDCMIFAWMVEFDGTYSKKDRIHFKINPDSGGNVILLTPSLWFSTKRWIFQGGISLPIIQKLNGHQQKIGGAFLFSIGWTA